MAFNKLSRTRARDRARETPRDARVRMPCRLISSFCVDFFFAKVSLACRNMSAHRVALRPRTDAAHRAEVDDKVARLRDAFADALAPSTHFTVVRSPTERFRSRLRFQIVRLDARGGADADAPPRLAYAMWSHGAPNIVLDAPCSDAVMSVQKVMGCLLERVATTTLEHALEAVHFLAESARGDDVLVTLVYSKPLDAAKWLSAARALADSFTDVRLAVTGRSKGQTLRVGDDCVHEEYALADGRTLRYKHIEGSFSNPNARITEATMNFLCECARDVIARAKPDASMLELYCGNANHTCALASMFRTIVGVEINSELVDAANHNLALNGVTNAEIVLSDSQNVAKNLLSGTFRAKTTNGVRVVSKDQFDAVLVDPPRAGLDAATLKLVCTFDFVMYVSCGPAALLENIRDGLGREHVLKRFVVLDHFPFTNHVEVACLFHLER